MSMPDLKACSRPPSASRARWRACATSWRRKTVEGETGGGLVRCTANGTGEVLSLTIDAVDRAATTAR